METELTATVVAAVGFSAFMIGLAKGGLAGLGPIVTVTMALVVPSTVAIGLLLPLLMVGDVVALAALWRQVQWSIVKPVVATAAVGVAVASFALASLSPEGLKIGIAVITLVFAAYRTLVMTRRMATTGAEELLAGRRAGAVAGFVTGVTSTLAHTGGPPVAIHLLARKVAPLAYAGTSAAIFWAVNWLKVPGYALAGLLDVDLLITLSPAALLIGPGVLVGRYVVGRLNQRLFEILVLMGLVVGAVLLLLR